MPSRSTGGGGGCCCGIGKTLSFRGSSAAAFFANLTRQLFSFSRIFKLLSKLCRHRLGLVRVLPVSQHSIVLPKELHHGFVPHSGHWTGVIVEGRAEVDFAAEPMLKSTVPTDWNLK
jgi:hypothetical protein